MPVYHQRRFLAWGPAIIVLVGGGIALGLLTGAVESDAVSTVDAALVLAGIPVFAYTVVRMRLNRAPVLAWDDWGVSGIADDRWGWNRSRLAWDEVLVVKIYEREVPLAGSLTVPYLVVSSGVRGTSSIAVPLAQLGGEGEGFEVERDLRAALERKRAESG